MPNEQLVQLRDRARETDRALATAVAQQEAAQTTLDQVRQKITALGFDPDDANLEEQVGALLGNAEVLLNEANTKLARVQEAAA